MGKRDAYLQSELRGFSGQIESTMVKVKLTELANEFIKIVI